MRHTSFLRIHAVAVAEIWHERTDFAVNIYPRHLIVSWERVFVDILTGGFNNRTVDE